VAPEPSHRFSRLRAGINKMLGVSEPDGLAQEEYSRENRDLGAGGSDISTACTPPCTPPQTAHWTPLETPPCTPACTSEHAPVCAPAPTYAVHDAAGVVIGLSDVDLEADTPLRHAAWVLWCALESNGLRGRWVLASVLRHAYRKYARGDGLDPMPWKTVASALRELVRWEYKRVRIGGRLRKRLAYLMPERLVDLAESNVVELAAERKRA
jgi:hypothetical protein